MRETTVSDGIEIRRSVYVKGRFEVHLTSPEGRQVILFAEPGDGKDTIELWIDMKPRSDVDDRQERSATRAAEASLDAPLDAIARSVGRSFGNGERGLMEAIASGIALLTGRKVTVADVAAAIERDRERYEAAKAQHDRMIGDGSLLSEEDLDAIESGLGM